VQIDFLDTSVTGAYVLEPKRKGDDRGFFALMYSAADFATMGLEIAIAQVNIAHNVHRGTLRGMHYQLSPHDEVKVVRCTRGRVYDVVLDLRQDSPTNRRWFATELSAENRRSTYVPRGCAHGYLTLEDDTEVTYLVSTPYAPSHYRGVRWNDPAFGIEWPFAPAHLHQRDAEYTDWTG
jgi:dTDP-4-dehydrorhamnose 3,5-epimerase